MPTSRHPRSAEAPRRRWARWLGWGALLALLLGLSTLLMVVLLRQPVEDLVGIEQAVRRWKYVGVLVQLGVIGAIEARWPQIVDWAQQHRWVGAHERARALALRWKVMLVLLIFQLAVVIGPAEFYRWVRSGL